MASCLDQVISIFKPNVMPIVSAEPRARLFGTVALHAVILQAIALFGASE
jgi:hypothetical protein